MSVIVSVKNLSKTYSSGHVALRDVNLDIMRGEILALLGPNGAGKTTLISIICGLVNASKGEVLVDGYDNVRNYRHARKMIGLVPQEITLGVFDLVWNTVAFSRGLFGYKTDPEFLDQLLKDLSLFEKKKSQIRELSGGMKRRVLIAKALSHQPKILFLDEPTAGVDVELRRDMWRLVSKLRDNGVTIILTTHYIEEAEAIADRVGVINNGSLILVDEKRSLMERFGKKQLALELSTSIDQIPSSLSSFELVLSDDGTQILYSYNKRNDTNSVNDFLRAVHQAQLPIADMDSRTSSLEDIFVDLVQKKDELASN